MGTQVSLLTLGNLQKVHTFLLAKNAKDIPESFGSFVGSLAQAPDPRKNFLKYSVLTHPDRNSDNKEEATEIQTLVNAFTNAQNLQETLTSLSENSTKKDHCIKLKELVQLLKSFFTHDYVDQNINIIDDFIAKIDNYPLISVHNSIKTIEENILNLFKLMPEEMQLNFISTIYYLNTMIELSNLNNLFLATYLVHSQRLSLLEKLIKMSPFIESLSDKEDVKLCKNFIKQLVNDKHLVINEHQQILMRENNRYVQIPVEEPIKAFINDCSQQKVHQLIEEAFSTGSKSIAAIIDSTPDNYLPIGLGKQLKNIEQTFGLKTLQSLGQIANLETHNFEAVLKKILRHPNMVNDLSLEPNLSFLKKLNTLCGILTHDQENIKLSSLLQKDLGIPDHQLEALIKLRIKDKFSIYRINLKDEHNLDMVFFKQDNIDLDVMLINCPNQQALRVCQKMHAEAHLEVIKDFIKKTEPQVLVKFMNIIIRYGEINEESIKKNPEQTIVNLFKNKQIGTSKLLQIFHRQTNIISSEVYSAFIKLQLVSNNFSVHQLKKQPDGTGEVTLKNTLISSTRPIYVSCTANSYALLEKIKSQQVS